MIAKLKNGILYLYLFIMLGIFPLFYKKQYAKMGTSKFQLFFYISLICLGLLFLLFLLQGIGYIKNRKHSEVTNNRIKFSIMDIGVICYSLCVILSFLFCDYKGEALLGAKGWSMGLASQMIFCAAYFFLSRDLKFRKEILYILFVSSSLVFLLGILHRFDIDPLKIRVGLSEENKKMFLSTIGQSSWYSSFACTMFPLGVTVFFLTKEKRMKILFGIYSALTFMTLVTQNSDSAYLSLAAVFLLLYYVSFDKAEQKKRFLQLLILMLLSFKAIGILQVLFKERATVLDRLSIWMSQSMTTTIIFVVTVCLYLWKYHIQKREPKNCKNRKPFYILLSAGVAVLIGTVLFIVLNSNGFLLKTFGYQNTNNYLLFQDNWGNNRGFTWKFTVSSYRDLPIMKKIFGVGPDCFKAYLYSIPEYAERLNEYWNGLNLTNAHNEYLTVLYNLGILGFISFLIMIFGGIFRFVKGRIQNPYSIAFALCIASYAAHNFFCYQQVCCTPFLFIIMGIGENILRTDHETKNRRISDGGFTGI